jgi:hypothetical protein
MARLSEELGNRMIEGIKRSMEKDPKDLRYFGAMPEMPKMDETFVEKMSRELVDRTNYDIAHRIDLEVPVVYYKGLDRIVIGTARIASGGVADITIGGFDGEDFGNILHPDALHVSIGLQQPMRWMPEMRINNVELDRSIYRAQQAIIENEPE